MEVDDSQAFLYKEPPFISPTDSLQSWNAAEDFSSDNEAPSLIVPWEGVIVKQFFDVKDPINAECPILIIEQKRRLKKKRKVKKTLSTNIQSEQSFVCSECKQRFSSGRALGGHMSKMHPGKSEPYKLKTQKANERAKERAKFLLAKQRFFNTLNCNYEELSKSKEGKAQLKKMLNRNKIRFMKKEISEEDVEDYLNSKSNLLK